MFEHKDTLGHRLVISCVIVASDLFNPSDTISVKEAESGHEVTEVGKQLCCCHYNIYIYTYIYVNSLHVFCSGFNSFPSVIILFPIIDWGKCR